MFIARFKQSTGGLGIPTKKRHKRFTFVKQKKSLMLNFSIENKVPYLITNRNLCFYSLLEAGRT